MKVEKERKFKLNKMPDNIDLRSGIRLEQYYLRLSQKETARGFDVKRIRMHIRPDGTGKFYLTFKSRGLMERLESEKEISKEEFDSLKKTALKYISKIRHVYALNGFKIELDIFDGRDLIIAEVESPEAEKFQPPCDWEEVTGDPAYQNVNLALYCPKI